MRKAIIFIMASAMLALSSCGLAPIETGPGVQVVVSTEYQPDAGCVSLIEGVRKTDPASEPLYVRYKALRVVDIHNHGASQNPTDAIRMQDTYFIDRTIFFGDISEPSAVETDRKAFEAYRQYPDKIIPFFAGIPLREQAGLVTAKQNLEDGYYGIGEIVAASTYSPVTSRLPWKANNPNDGILPEIYQLSAAYRAPILLHIDPPTGEPIPALEQALEENPNAIIIFGHANAYNSPENIETLVRAHTNLYFDFFAGFTAYNAESANRLSDFAALMERYPNQFMVSTDSGFGVGPEKALMAIYEMLDLLSPQTACSVSHQNIDRLIESIPPTQTQIHRIETLSKQNGMTGVRTLNKRAANELIFAWESR